MQKIVPFLWFNDNAEEAVNFYIATFRDSKIISESRMGDKYFTGSFQLEGQTFMALNGGPMFTFSPAISLFVNCNTQDEVDELWDKLSDGGEIQQCGWLKDKYGISWQIIPTILRTLLHDPNPVKSQNVMQSMLKMKKIDIAALQAAYDVA